MYWKDFLTNIVNGLRKGDFGVLKSIRYYSLWKESQNASHNSVVDEQPWITYDAIRKLEEVVKPGFRVFEYGGGGSTLFFLKKEADVITVEHDEVWFTRLREVISKKSRTNWKGFFVPAEPYTGPALDIAEPTHYYSDDPNFKSSTFKKYVAAIDQYPDEHFDLVMVDGRARTSCLHHSFPKVKKGGYLVLDNSERTYYTSKQLTAVNSGFRLILSSFAAVPYSTSFSRTTIWQRK